MALDIILKLLSQLILFKAAGEAPGANIKPDPTPTPPKPVEPPKIDSKPIIDWTDPNCKISQYFTVKEAIWFPQWNRLATEADGLTEAVKTSLLRTFIKMDRIRDYIGKPIRVHIAFRSREYNTLIKGARNSAHLTGNAVDFSANMGLGSIGANCDKIKELLIPVLEEWELRLEDNGSGATWVHIDRNPVPQGGNRFFKP